MTQPSFQEAEKRARYARTEQEIAARLARYERLGRRCDGAKRTCHNNAATWEMVVSNHDRGTDTWSEPTTIKVCARHRAQLLRFQWTRVISETHLVEKSE